MRFVAFLFIASLSIPALAAPPAKRHPKPKTETKAAQVDPLPPTKADPAVAGRALLVKELPKNVTAADRAKLDAVVAQLRADHLETGVSLYRAWAAEAPPKHLLREEAQNVALWVFREGLLSKSDEVSNAADRVRFFDERNAAIDDSLALIRGAVIARKPVLIAKLVVLTPYVKETRGDDKRERQVIRDAYDTEIKTLEPKGDEARAERERARATFAALDAKTGQWMQALGALVKASNEMRLNPAGGA